MSRPYDGRAMDRPSGMAGSVRRARERAEAGLPIEYGQPIPEPTRTPPRRPVMDTSGASPRTNRPQAPPGWYGKDGQGPMPISRPMPVPQWPLSGQMGSAGSAESDPYRPPQGRPDPPQRPPRPSKVPSILDGSRVQDHTPVFQYAPRNGRSSDVSTPLETPQTTSSRPSTLSSVGSIPDFPLPAAAPQVSSAPLAPPPPVMPSSRRSANLGPPPSSRRGQSSFYSTASFVSPIPEESPRSRSRASYASSSVMPEYFGGVSPTDSHGPSFDDTIVEESMLSDDADERGLVRSASIGKRGKPSLVDAKSPSVDNATANPARPTPKPVQDAAFEGGTGFYDSSSSSSDLPAAKGAVGEAMAADNMLSAYQNASATDVSGVPGTSPTPRAPSRFSAIRRPPRLDIDAVRDAEARGSLTSLPDLIRRATRLATMMDKGRRPGSRFDDLDFPDDMYPGDRDRYTPYDMEKHASGLSDMLAAFPPPATSRQSMRHSGMSWFGPFPRAMTASRSPGFQAYSTPQPEKSQKPRRRCCGLPVWGFFLVLLLVLGIIATAIVVPLHFFVFNDDSNDGAQAEPITSDCAAQLECANGGTNVVSQGVCSCICSNGFTGKDCTTPSSQGCTTTSINSPSGDLNNVTLGMALPRLLEDAQSNYSLPLDATKVLAKSNSADLSCNGQNALVTFDGESMSEASLSQLTQLEQQEALAMEAAKAVPVTITVSPGLEIVITAKDPSNVFVTTIPPRTTMDEAAYPTTTMDRPTTTSSTTSAPTSTLTSTSSTAMSPTMTTQEPQPTGGFEVTSEVVDFARVAVLYVFQQESLMDAADAQSNLQKFLDEAAPATTKATAASSSGGGVTVEQARNVSLGSDNTIDLVGFFLDLGSGRIGGGPQ